MSVRTSWWFLWLFSVCKLELFCQCANWRCFCPSTRWNDDVIHLQLSFLLIQQIQCLIVFARLCLLRPGWWCLEVGSTILVSGMLNSLFSISWFHRTFLFCHCSLIHISDYIDISLFSCRSFIFILVYVIHLIKPPSGVWHLLGTLQFAYSVKAYCYILLFFMPSCPLCILLHFLFGCLMLHVHVIYFLQGQ